MSLARAGTPVDGSHARDENDPDDPTSESAVFRPADTAFRTLHLVLATCALSLLSACGSAPPKPTVIEAAVEAADDLNPDSRARASPVVVRLFELKSDAAFNRADFFSLWDRETQTLGADQLAREELQLRPGERKRFERTLQPDTRHVAVIAAFRDLERARWRASAAVVPHQKQPITIKVESRAITLSTE
ncbi:MAG: type VI secretion system lipoprotein TssJ [Betaproteobacteria bacterium]|nr:MAG: type VI secretion system lipoprotein TssJ [Betaproteobacteria bacterium]